MQFPTQGIAVPPVVELSANLSLSLHFHHPFAQRAAQQQRDSMDTPLTCRARFNNDPINVQVSLNLLKTFPWLRHIGTHIA